MPRTKGSKNKKLILINKGNLRSASNFKSMELKSTKTQIFQIAFSKSDIEEALKYKTRELAGYSMFEFEKQEVVYDKKGNAFVTLTNPIMKETIKEKEFAPKEVIKEVRNEFGGK